jgi:hypothetical protein
MHIADGVTGLFAPRSRNDRRSESLRFPASAQVRILHHDLVCSDAIALDVAAGKAWKEDFVFQVHVPDEIVGKFLGTGVKRAP